MSALAKWLKYIMANLQQANFSSRNIVYERLDICTMRMDKRLF